MKETTHTCPRCSHTWDQESPYLKGEELVEAAKELAREVHSGQVRKLGKDKGSDYFETHLTRVAKRTQFFHPLDYEAQAVSWLHDSIEDFPERISVQRLKDMWFPPSVINGILAMTRREGEPYLDYLKRAFMDELARTTKWYDMTDNGHDGSAKYQLGIELFNLWTDCLGLKKTTALPKSARFLNDRVIPEVGDYGRPSPGGEEVVDGQD